MMERVDDDTLVEAVIDNVIAEAQLSRYAQRRAVWIGKDYGMAGKTDAEKAKIAKEKARVAKEKEKAKIAKEREREKARKLKEKQALVKEKEKARKAKAKEKAAAAKAKAREKAGAAPKAQIGDIKLTGNQKVCLDYILANPGCPKLGPADQVDTAENHHRMGYACVNALIKKGLVEAKEKQDGGRRKYALYPTKLAKK